MKRLRSTCGSVQSIKPRPTKNANCGRLPSGPGWDVVKH
jgi:hypothetical protein